jgi:hypothetical protein
MCSGSPVAERGRVLTSRERDEGVVVEEDALWSPYEEHRLCSAERLRSSTFSSSGQAVLGPSEEASQSMLLKRWRTPPAAPAEALAGLFVDSALI